MMWPRLRDVERELYPTLSQMYAELARPTPRPRQPPPRRVASSLMLLAAATQGEAAQAPKGSGSC